MRTVHACRFLVAPIVAAVMSLVGSNPAVVSAQSVLLGVDVSTTVGGPSTLITIDPITGAGTAIGPVTGFPSITGLAFAPDGTLFGVSTADFGGTGEFIEIDPATGDAIAIGFIGFTGIDALAVAHDGTIFAAVQPGASTPGGPFLATIDRDTGAGTLIGAFGPGICVEALAFSPDGALFGAADIFGSCSVAQTLINIDTTTGASTIIGPIGFPDVDAMSFTADGGLFAADLGTGILLSINPETGQGTAIGPIGFCCIAGLASPLVRRVTIDIKPGSNPNCFNNNMRGVIPVAILSNADFDATQVDPSTLELAGLAVKVAGKSNKFLAHFEDVDGDGLFDLVVQIEDTDHVFTPGMTTGTLTGTLYDGTPIEGEDDICIVP